MDGWIDGLRFYVLFNSIQSYQDDVWMMMKGCVQWNLVYARKDFHLNRDLNLGPLDKLASA